MYYKCTNCGQLYYSAARLSDDKLICEKCGAIVEPFEGFKKQATQGSEKERSTTTHSSPRFCKNCTDH